MVDCDYCGESFDDEEAYLDHLESSHDGELGAIDQRRVTGRKSDEESGVSLMALAVGIGAVIAVGAVIYLTFLSGGASADGIEAADLNETGDSQLLSGVEQFENEGREHVASSRSVDYEQSPPLSGPHYNSPAEGGFYEETQPAGNLVHSLEHGAVVIYYNESALDEGSEESLRQFASTHTGTWRSVIAVPNPSDNPEADYVLTAWRNRMYMSDYDARTVHAFLSEFLGRGPENPVR